MIILSLKISAKYKSTLAKYSGERIDTIIAINEDLNDYIEFYWYDIGNGIFKFKYNIDEFKKAPWLNINSKELSFYVESVDLSNKDANNLFNHWISSLTRDIGDRFNYYFKLVSKIRDEVPDDYVPVIPEKKTPNIKKKEYINDNRWIENLEFN